jgi:hypothetical protein
LDFIETLEREWSVIVSAPRLAFPLVAIGAYAAWWFRGRNAAGEIASLKAQIEVLKSQAGASDNRRLLSEDKLADMKLKGLDLEAKVAELQKNFHTLNNQMRSLRSTPDLLDANGQTESSIKNVAIATSDLSGTISVLRGGAGNDRSHLYASDPSVP